MDNKEFQKQLAELDRSSEHTAELATTVVSSFYKKLRDKGVSDVAAIELTKTYLGIMLTMFLGAAQNRDPREGK